MPLGGLSLLISSPEIVPRHVQKKVQYIDFTHFLRDPYDEVKCIKKSFEAGAVIKVKDSVQ